MERAMKASETASALRPDLPEAQVAQGWMLYANRKLDETVSVVRKAIGHKPDCEGGYYLLGRTLFTAGRYQEVVDIAEAAIEAGGDDYNMYIPVLNALGALGKEEALRNWRQRMSAAMDQHLHLVPEDARAHTLLAGNYAAMNRVDEAIRETNFAIALRPNEANVLYNGACVFCLLKKKPEALDALRRAWDAGYTDAEWARRDPDLALLHDDPEFERLYPENAVAEPG
jgi:non-specific serine/threonine protein kinase